MCVKTFYNTLVSLEKIIEYAIGKSTSLFILSVVQSQHVVNLIITLRWDGIDIFNPNRDILIFYLH